MVSNSNLALTRKKSSEHPLLQYEHGGCNISELGTPVKFLLPGSNFRIGATLLITTLKVISSVYDTFTWFGYYGFQKKRRQERLKLRNEIKAEIVSSTDGTSKTWRANREIRDIHVELEKGNINTMHKVFTLAIRKFGSKQCLGTRDLLTEENHFENGKLLKKCELGQYRWKTYTEVEHLATHFALGLTTLNLKPKESLCIFAETRAEWFVAAVGAFKNNYTIATLYSTLGEDAIVHGLNQTEATVVLTSSELLPKFRSILQQTSHVRHVIYMEHQLHQETVDASLYPGTISIYPFSEIIQRGRKVIDIKLEAPEPDDVAIIMYTSGSTAVPKGVLLSHKNVAAAMFGVTDGFGPVFPDDIYVGYLPLAHVMELAAEAVCFLQGVRIGYSSPLTLTNSSLKIKPGCTGDAVELRPTLMVGVPFALDRIHKMIKSQVDEGSAMKRAIFYFAYDYKLKWNYKGYDTPLVDRTIMKKTKMALGGRVRVLVSGGAPLAVNTHEFVQNCFCISISQGYGLTETCASATCTIQGDTTLGSIGPPLRCTDIRLVNWDDGNYTVNDVPLPRGELVVGGDVVALGYFKTHETTTHDFFLEDGKRWFRTGDIAAAEPDGSFRIIDRKKDLVKLQRGEYLSMGKIESIFKTFHYIENICVYGDPSKDVCVALVTPIQKQLELLSASLGNGDKLTLAEMCLDAEVESAFLELVQSFASTTKLHRFEIPAALKLCPEPWTPDNDMVTSTFKLKRRNVQKVFQADIDRMYAGLKTNE